MKKFVFNIVSILLGLLLLNGGLNKYFHYMPVPDHLPDELVADTLAILEIAWLMPLIGFAEILGGALILIPRTRALGALVVFPVTVGILLTHVFTAPDGLFVALVIWAILGWIIWENRRKYLPILSTNS
jgi:putative oxidoreductase